MSDPERSAKRINMTKREATWLSIRITGLLIALFGIKQSFVFLYLVFVFLAGGLHGMPEEFCRSMLSTTWPMSISGVLMLAIGAYFLFAGKAVYKILIKEE